MNGQPQPRLEWLWREVDDLNAEKRNIMKPFLDYSAKSNQEVAPGKFAQHEETLLQIQRQLDALYIEIEEIIELARENSP